MVVVMVVMVVMVVVMVVMVVVVPAATTAVGCGPHDPSAGRCLRVGQSVGTEAPAYVFVSASSRRPLHRVDSNWIVSSLIFVVSQQTLSHLCAIRALSWGTGTPSRHLGSTIVTP